MRGGNVRREIDWWKGFDRLQAALDDEKGMFLLVPGSSGNPNPMTISWGQVGFVWSRPIFTVFVRRSRYTYECLRTADSFTVNVPAPDRLAEELSVCGTRSGRETDKMQACSLRTRPSERVSAPYLSDCDLHYECRIVARTQLTLPDVTADDVIAEHYPKDDLHLLVLGEIVGAYVRDDG